MKVITLKPNGNLTEWIWTHQNQIPNEVSDLIYIKFNLRIVVDITQIKDRFLRSKFYFEFYFSTILLTNFVLLQLQM